MMILYTLGVLTASAAAGFLFGAVLALIVGSDPVVLGALCAVAVLGALCAVAVMGGIAWAWAQDKGD